MTQDDRRRLAREKKTVAEMIRIYCRGHHDGGRGLCAECSELHDYAMCRLDRCPFGEEKTSCAKCPIHCYKPAMRERIREVMRYSGPRMMFHHPILALRHQRGFFRFFDRLLTQIKDRAGARSDNRGIDD